jgi:hypothetical protein
MRSHRPALRALSLAALPLALSLAGCFLDPPLPPQTYSMPNGESGSQSYLDDIYDGQGSAATPGDPLSGGLGKLTDGVVPTIAADLDSTPWVGWNDQTTAILFDFGARAGVGAVELTLDAPAGAGSPMVDLTIRAARMTKTLQVPANTSGDPQAVTCDITHPVGRLLSA